MTNWDFEERARKFWADTDLAEIYPRPIEQAVALKLPVAVVKLPVVTVATVGRWLRRRHRTPVFPSYQHDLMGCLYADRGHGFIFVCGVDGPEEQRFTVAHDTAHFLVDYWWPRGVVIESLGPRITAVLDGERPASLEERALAVLAHVRLGAHWHLLPRRDADPDDNSLADIENRADDLGLELVAPRQRVLERLRAMPRQQSTDRHGVCAALGNFFGLPPYVFEPIVIAEQGPTVPSFLDEALRLLRR